MAARESKTILESIIEEYDKDFSILYYPNAGHAVVATPSEVAEVLHSRYGALAGRLAFASPFPLPQDCAAEIIGGLRSHAAPA